MSLRVGLISAAHVHTPSYAHNFSANPRAEISGLWDDDVNRGTEFADKRGIPFFSDLQELLDQSDAVAISSENTKHLAHIEVAANAGKHIICEKPVVVRLEDFDKVREAVSQNKVKFMTAFPCRFSPAYQSLKQRVNSGELGEIKAINATNRGQCPEMWFIEPALSGGGAMIDHVVHVADLLRDLLGEEPSHVEGQTGSNIYGGKDWDDTAMVSLDYPSGIFATLDSSWSRPTSFRTWGDVTLKVVGTNGVLHANLFDQSISHFKNGRTKSLADQSYGSDLDGAMMGAFVNACLDGADIPVTLEDGLAAALVSLRAYESIKSRVA